jgi:hypothetical protein|nr:MAG TPA: hypothetical protein [Caudoviricetes sp.]
MIKLTNKMRDCLMIFGRYEAARWTYEYDHHTCTVTRYKKNDTTPVEVLHIDLMKKGVKA